MSKRATAAIDAIKASCPVYATPSEFIVNLDEARNVLAVPLHYSQPVEAEVDASLKLVKNLLPNLTTQDEEFLSIWHYQELQHAAAQLDLLNAFGITPGPMAEKHTWMSALVGGLASISPGFSDIATVGTFSYMALGEYETRYLYRVLAKQLTHAKQQKLSRQMGLTAHQEGLHLDYQWAAVEERYEKLRPWQQRAARLFLERMYLPVGIQRGNGQRKQEFGGVILCLSADNGIGVAVELEMLAGRLLEVNPGSAFVQRRYKDCIMSFQDQHTKQAA